jgi:KDO2-lipid IV(A) lauroyltransferase
MADRQERAPPLRWAWGDAAKKAAFHRYWVHDLVHGLLGLGLYYGVKPYPVAFISAIGARVGEVIGPRRGPTWDRRARENIARLRPDLDVEVTVRTMWRNVGRAMMEFSALDRLWRGRMVRFIGEEHLLAAKRAAKPRILLLLHLGNWELPGGVLHLLDEPFLHFHQPPRNRFERFIARRARKSVHDNLLFPNPADTLKGVRYLAKGQGSLVIAADEFIDGRVHGPFFGREPRIDGNIGFVARMASKTGAMVIPAYAIRRDGTQFDLHFEQPIEAPAEGSTEEKIIRMAVAINAAIEPIILAHLDQWLMLHDLRFDRP